MSKIDEHNTAGERERTYKFLSSLCLKPPSDSLISMIEDGSILTGFKSGVKGYSELWKFVNEAPKITDLKSELEAEHTALFALPSGVIPQEAAYLDKERRLGGRVTISVKQFYEKAGAEILDNCIEMPDHMGMELEFMGFLCKLEKELWAKADLQGLRKCIELQKAFLDEHLSKWAHQCCKEIIKRAEYSFYKAAAHLITDFVGSEEEYITELYAKLWSDKKEEACKTTGC